MINVTPQNLIGIHTAPPEKILFHYAEDIPAVTSGSLSDLPDNYLGTASWWPGVYVPASYRQGGSGSNAIELTETVSTYAASSLELTTDSVTIDYEMTRLEAAAQAGNESAFLAIQRTMDWQNRPPEDFVRAAQLALAAGAHRAARHLSTLGAERYPDHPELLKYARVLAPPKVTRSARQPDPTLKANRDWLVAHGDRYRGHWVALQNGELVSSASSLQSLSDQIGDTKGLLLTKVF